VTAAADLLPYSFRRFDRGDGIGMNVLDEGEGPTVVMVHGNPTWSFFYRHLVEALRADHRVIVPDHVGMGRSDCPSDDDYAYTLDSRVDDLEKVIEDAAPDGPVSLIVHDWGGMIGLGWAERHRERLRSVVIMNTAGFPLMEGKSFPRSLHWIRNTPFGPALVRGLNAFCRTAVRRCVAKPMPAEVRAGYLDPYDTWEHRRAVLRFVQDIPLAEGDPAWKTLSKVDAFTEHLRTLPVLLPWGLRDFIFDGDFLEEWKRRLPDAEAHPFEDAGHYLMEDRGDAVVPLIRDFVTKHEAAS
jgi:haloalkane dehalogenase